MTGQRERSSPGLPQLCLIYSRDKNGMSTNLGLVPATNHCPTPSNTVHKQERGVLHVTVSMAGFRVIDEFEISVQSKCLHVRAIHWGGIGEFLQSGLQSTMQTVWRGRSRMDISRETFHKRRWELIWWCCVEGVKYHLRVKAGQSRWMRKNITLKLVL